MRPRPEARPEPAKGEGDGVLRRFSSRPHLRPPPSGAEVEGEDFARVDWWGAELEGVTFTRCRFDDAGLEELVTRRCVFDRCVLTGVRLGGSRHHGTAFLSCRFDRARLFDATLDGCKLTGSWFPGAELRPLTATECDWSYTSLRGVDLSAQLLAGQRFREADLTDADLRGTDLSSADLDRARLQGAKLRGADLRGASTEELDWRSFELAGVRIDAVQAVEFARTHGALVGD